MIDLTSDALKEVQRLSRKHTSEQNPTRLRIGIQPGCCSDLSYALSFDAMFSNEDLAIDDADIPMVVRRNDLEFLKGLKIDYSEDLMGGAFRFLNPNATYTSDCGNSFSVTSNSAQVKK